MSRCANNQMTRREQQRAAQNKRCKSHLGSSVVFFSERVFPVVLFFVVCGEEEDDFAQPMRTSHLVSVLTFVSFVCAVAFGERCRQRLLFHRCWKTSARERRKSHLNFRALFALFLVITKWCQGVARYLSQ
jgi:hypothetical protein